MLAGFAAHTVEETLERATNSVYGNTENMATQKLPGEILDFHGEKGNRPTLYPSLSREDGEGLVFAAARQVPVLSGFLRDAQLPGRSCRDRSTEN